MQPTGGCGLGNRRAQHGRLVDPPRLVPIGEFDVREPRREDSRTARPEPAAAMTASHAVAAPIPSGCVTLCQPVRARRCSCSRRVRHLKHLVGMAWFIRLAVAAEVTPSQMRPHIDAGGHGRSGSTRCSLRTTAFSACLLRRCCSSSRSRHQSSPRSAMSATRSQCRASASVMPASRSMSLRVSGASVARGRYTLILRQIAPKRAVDAVQ